MVDSKLNHLLMIPISNEELDEINIKLRTKNLIKEKETRIATFWVLSILSICLL